MLYTVGYRGYTIWRKESIHAFSVSRTEARDLETLKRTLEHGTFRDFASARREVDWLKGGGR